MFAPMTEARRGRLQMVGAVLPRIAGKTLGKRGFGEAQLVRHWTEIVGERLAKDATPLKLNFPRGGRRDGTLKLRVAPGIALEIQHDEPVLLERINGFFGYRVVARLSLQQTGPAPSARPPRRQPLSEAETAELERRVDAIADTGLRTALMRLGAAILATQRK
jgi:hypothetical protein